MCDDIRQNKESGRKKNYFSPARERAISCHKNKNEKNTIEVDGNLQMEKIHSTSKTEERGKVFGH